MANLAVTTSAAQVPTTPGSTYVLQNLGGGDIYVGTSNTVTSSNGYKLVANAVLQFRNPVNQSGGAIWVIGSASADLRYLAV